MERVNGPECAEVCSYYVPSHVMLTLWPFSTAEWEMVSNG